MDCTNSERMSKNRYERDAKLILLRDTGYSSSKHGIKISVELTVLQCYSGEKLKKHVR